jgi:hypothetical protein
LIFTFPIYNHNWRNISTIYIYIYTHTHTHTNTHTHTTRLASNELFSPSNKIHREVGRAKDLSALLRLGPYLSARQHSGDSPYRPISADRTQDRPAHANNDTASASSYSFISGPILPFILGRQRQLHRYRIGCTHSIITSKISETEIGWPLARITKYPPAIPRQFAEG